MLARYHIVRGKRDPSDPLPAGHRMDTRMHTKHVLRPDADEVAKFLAEGDSAAFKHFRTAYLGALEQRFEAERERFDEIAELAKEEDVYLGCNCPTAKQPNVQHCHTALALGFMKKKYPKLRVVMPA